MLGLRGNLVVPLSSCHTGIFRIGFRMEGSEDMKEILLAIIGCLTAVVLFTYRETPAGRIIVAMLITATGIFYLRGIGKG